MLDEASGQVLIEHSVGLFGDDWVDSVRSRSGGCAALSNGRNLERDKVAGVEFSVDRGEIVGELAESIVQSSAC